MNHKKTEIYLHPDNLSEGSVYDVYYVEELTGFFKEERFIFKGMILPISIDQDQTIVMLFKKLKKRKNEKLIFRLQWSRIQKVVFLHEEE